MLRFVTGLSGVVMIIGGSLLLVGNLQDRYDVDGVEIGLCVWMIFAGFCTAAFVLRPNATRSDRLISAWMDLKRAEMQDRHDALIRNKGGS